jgi:hypothetical protein
MMRSCSCQAYWAGLGVGISGAPLSRPGVARKLGVTSSAATYVNIRVDLCTSSLPVIFPFVSCHSSETHMRVESLSRSHRTQAT